MTFDKELLYDRKASLIMSSKVFFPTVALIIFEKNQNKNLSESSVPYCNFYYMQSQSERMKDTVVN